MGRSSKSKYNIFNLFYIGLKLLSFFDIGMTFVLFQILGAYQNLMVIFRVFEVASGDLAGMGIVVISYTIKEISDDVGYLKVCYDHGKVSH